MEYQALIQTTLGGLGVVGIGWLIRQVVSVKSDLLQTKLDLKTEIADGFRKLNGRLGKVEEHMLGHERLDEERFDSASQSRERLRENLAHLEVRMR